MQKYYLQNCGRFNFLIIVFISFGFLNAQSRLDSLTKQIESKKEDTAKVNLLNFIASEYKTLNPDTAVYFTSRAIKLSKEIEYDKGLAYALLSEVTVDVNKGEHSEALKKLEIAYKIAEDIKDFDLMGLIYLKIALVDRKEGNYAIAVEKIMNAIDLFNMTSNIEGKFKTYSSLGNISYLRGNYPTSLNYHFEALKLVEHLNDLQNKAICLTNIGANYSELQKMDKYLEYTDSALIVFEQIGDNKSVAICYNNIGLSYVREGDFQLGKNYFLAALEKFKTVDSKDKMVECISNIGYVNYKLKQYSNAIEYFNHADSLAIVARNMNVIASNKLHRSQIYFETGNLEDGKITVLKGISEAKKLGNKSTLANAYQLLAKIDSASGNYPEALANYKLFKIYEDSVLFLEKETQMKLIESKYEDEMNILTLKYQNEQKSLELIENKKRTRISYYLIGAFILITIFAALAIINRFRLRQNKFLTQEKIKSQKEHFKAVINAQEKERTRIARDLHDGIGQSMSGMILQFEHLIDRSGNNGNGLKEMSQKIFNTMNEVYSELRNLSHQIMPRALKQVGIYAALSDLLSKTFAGTDIKYHLDTREDFNLIDEVAVGVYRITQELLTNIIKHAKAREVSVHLFTINTNLLLIVEDDGLGLIKTGQPKQEAGIGINNINGRVNMLNGSFTLEPGPERGTIATVKIPIKDKFVLDTKKEKTYGN